MKSIAHAMHPSRRGLRGRSHRRGTTLIVLIMLIPIGAVFFMIALDQMRLQRMALAQRENRAQLRALALSALTAWEARTAGRSFVDAMAALPLEGKLADAGTYRIEALDDPASPFTIRAVGSRTAQLDAWEYATFCEILIRPAATGGEAERGAPTMELSMPRYGAQPVEIDLSEPAPRDITTSTLPVGSFPADTPPGNILAGGAPAFSNDE